MNYQIKDLDEMILVSAEGKSRDDALYELEEYLQLCGVNSLAHYYIEIYSGGKVAGAMALAKVEVEPEHNRKYKASTLKKGPYLIFDYPYEDYVKSNQAGEKKLDVNEYLEDKDYRISGFPFFEFLKETDNQQIRIYVPLK